MNNSFVIPPLLKGGDTVGIVAPGRKLAEDVVTAATSIIESWGLHVMKGRNLFSNKHNYLSGTDEERLDDLQTMMNNPAVKAIICARGGYGSSRFIDHLDFTLLNRFPKWLIGFSDITSLELSFLRHGIASIHGTMPVLFPKPESIDSVESLRTLLFNGAATIDAVPSAGNVRGNATGIVVGGNLSLLVDSLGTKTEVETHGRILLIEEIDEYVYRIDRMMNQLKRAGKLDGLKGLVVGHMTDIKESELPFNESTVDIVHRLVPKGEYPIAFQFPSGHENPNLAWVQGGLANLEVSSSHTRLTFDLVTRDT